MHRSMGEIRLAPNDANLCVKINVGVGCVNAALDSSSWLIDAQVARSKQVGVLT